MPDSEQFLIYMYGFYALLGIAAIIGALKLLDWFIGLKYVSHLECEKCRTDIEKNIAIDHDLLQQLNTKMDLILDGLKVIQK